MTSFFGKNFSDGFLNQRKHCGWWISQDVLNMDRMCYVNVEGSQGDYGM